MTTNVKIEAHCAEDEVVKITIGDDTQESIKYLKNGETSEHYVYGNISIEVRETSKLEIE